MSLLDPPIEDVDKDTEVTWAGRKIQLAVRNLAPLEETTSPPKPGEGYIPAGPKKHAPAWKRPSEMEGEGKAGKPESIGDGFELKGDPNRGHLGDAIHGFFGADQEGLEESERLSIAQGLLERFGVEESLSSGDLVKAGDALNAWVKQCWPDAKWHRELPMMYKLDSGSAVRGICDLALETNDGWVVIDHKSRKTAEGVEEYAAQLKAYADGIAKATGQKILRCWIHLPLAGLIVPVESELP